MGRIAEIGYAGCNWDLADACEAGAVFWGAGVKLGIGALIFSVLPDSRPRYATRQDDCEKLSVGASQRFLGWTLLR